MADKVIKMPNGDAVNFGSMPDEQIKSLIEKRFPGTLTDPGSDVLDTVLPSVARLGINTAGMAGDIGSLVGRGADWAGSKLGIDPETIKNAKEAAKISPITNAFTGPTSADITQKVEEGIGAKLYQPKTTLGRVTDKAIQFGPGLFMGPEGATAALEGVLGRAATNVALPTAGSEAGGEIASNWGEGARPYGEAIGGLLSAKAPQPMRPASAEKLRQLDVLAGEGVTPLAGQVLNNRRLMARQAEAGGGVAATEAAIAQKENMTRAALRRVGVENESYATPEVMKANIERMGKEFDDLGTKNTFLPTKNFHNDLTAVGQDYKRLGGEMPAIPGYIADLKAWKPGARIDGKTYAKMRERITTDMRRVEGSDKKWLSEILERLDDQMEKNISPADAARWKKVRREYRNNFVIQKAINADHVITAPALRTAARTQDLRGFVTGKNDFTELSDAGSALLKEMPSSGTSERLLARLRPPGGEATVGGGAGGAVAHFLGVDPWVGAGIGAVALPVAKHAYAKAIMSPTTQKWLIGRAAKGDPTAVMLLQAMQTSGKLTQPEDDLWLRQKMLEEGQRK